MASAILIPHRAFDSIAVGSAMNASHKCHLDIHLTELRRRALMPELRALFRDISRYPEYWRHELLASMMR
ncbi:hypothetical protein [Burkholderia lata]|uniref:hypothetical protein n=1 Tax=Burkholderia lata (strain ATCC 17760 / DSM 23089 / LMG 22485 / NCIMB 9086 / R18194 / 383) TaxID=482957 RepID=UPI001583D5D7|nr:hypothetical protein [Burkholderia lata]